jgi:phosphoribosylformylglycinamidine cyclo-ligase
MSDKYLKRGVSGKKEDVHHAVGKLDKGLFPGSFCKILPDYLGNDPDYCNLVHADGAGTKSSLAYIMWKETGDLSVWKDIAQDAIIMNIDDLLCVGATGPFIVSSTIGRNKMKVPGEVVSALINGFSEVCSDLSKMGVECVLAGGETADVGDLVRTVIVDSTVVCRMKRRDVVVASSIKAGDVIVGLASYGKSAWETNYNSGIGSNGLTFARHETFGKKLAERFPESFDSEIDPEYVYSGKLDISDKSSETGMTAGKMLLSPTRTYAPLFVKMLAGYRDKINGMIHCTGGGQTKVMNFVEGLHVIKDNLLPVPPVFSMIQSQSSASWEEMYRVFNMGHRMEVYTDASTAAEIVQMSLEAGVDASVIGRCESSDKNQLTLKTKFGTFIY